MPIDFSNIKTTRGRAYDEDNISGIYEALEYLPDKQRASVLATIIEESGGNPLAVSDGGTYQGLLQWGADRYRIQSNDPKQELANQLKYLKESIYNTSDSKSWTDGGIGSGYRSFKNAYRDFNDTALPLEKIHRGFSYGYVRPRDKEESYQNRLKVAEQVLSRMPAVPDYVSNPGAFNSILYRETNKKSSGGQLKHKMWNDLSLAEKDAMIAVAVKNGITDLPTIRQKYNEFAGGGTLPGREDSNNHILNAGLKVAKFLGIDKSIKGDAGDVHYRQNLYNHIDPTAPYPTSAKEAFLYFKKAQAAKSKENLPKERSTTDLVADAAWAKRLGLTYDKTQLIDNPDGSVHLPKSVEMEIPTDTAFLKNRIKANEDLLNYYRNIGGVSKDRKDVINAGLNLDRMALESLRHTYKTGEPAIINEGANISRRLIENGLVVSKPSPLNVLQNFTVKYNKDKNEMEYSDVYDFNQYEDFVPGKPFVIKGTIKLSKK